MQPTDINLEPPTGGLSGQLIKPARVVRRQIVGRPETRVTFGKRAKNKGVVGNWQSVLDTARKSGPSDAE